MAERVVKVRLSAEVQEYQRAMQEAAEATRKTQEETKKAQDRAKAWSTLGTGLAVVGGAMTALTFAVAKTGIEYNTLQQTSRAALRTLLGGAEAANAQMDRLDEFARTSPFSKAVFIDAQQQLLGFGMAAERVVPTLDAIQNAVAATGGSNQDIRELVRIIAQLEGGVKISAETFNQFGARGVDAAGIIGEAMGKTGQQIRQEVTAGTLDADAAIQALVDGMQNRFGGAAANVKETFEGAMDRVKAAWRDVSAELMTPLVDPNGGGALVDFLNWVADLMRAFQALPEPVKLASGAMFAATGIISTLSGAVILAAPKVKALWGAFQTLSGTMKGFALAGGGAVVALGALVAVVAAVSAAHAEAQRKAEAYADTLEDGTRRVTKATREMAAEALSARDGFLWMETDSAYEAAEKLGIGLDLVTDAALGNVDAMRELNRQLDEGREGIAQTSAASWDYENAAVSITNAVKGESESIERAIEVAELKARATESAARSSEDAAEAYLNAAAGAKELTDRILTLIDAMNESNNAAQDAVSKNARWLKELASIGEQAEDNGTSLDQMTVAGAENAAMLAGVASAAMEASQAQFEVDEKTVGAVRATEMHIERLATQRQNFEEAAVAAGFNADEVKRLADRIFEVPNRKEAELLVNTARAHQAIDGFIAAMNGRTVTIDVTTRGVQGNFGKFESDWNYQGNLYENGMVQAFASGGFPSGIYGGRYGGIHKFAEAEMGVPWEAYISGRAADRDRNIGIWMETGRRLGAMSAQSGPQSVQVSLAGAEFIVNIDGNPVRAVVQEQLVQYDAAAERVSRGGVRV